MTSGQQVLAALELDGAGERRLLLAPDSGRYLRVEDSVPVAALAAALRKLNQNLKRLTRGRAGHGPDDRSRVPRQPYETRVAEDVTRARFRGDPDLVDDVLDAPHSRTSR